jgi:hypothetical protein
MNLPDHAQLLGNIIKWAAKDSIPPCRGTGLVDCHIYKQQGRLVLHFVNLTNSATWRQPVHELISVGPFNVKIKLPSDFVGGSVRTLISGHTIKAGVSKGWCEFQIKSILDHEVIVIS